MSEDFEQLDIPAPIETGNDISDPSAHAFQQQQLAEQEAQATDKGGKLPSIRDSLKTAEKAATERAHNKLMQETLGKPLDKMTAKERRELASWLREQKPESDEEKEARKGLLAEFKKLEPKRDKPESVSDGWKNREGALKRAFESQEGKLNKADLSTTEQRQIRADIKARWPDKNLGDVIGYFWKVHEALTKNPHSWEQLAREYAEQTNPLNDKKGEAKDQGKNISDSLKRAAGDLEDMTGLAPWIKKFGKDLPELLRRANEWDKAMREDPYGTAARLSAMLGGLREPQQQVMQQQPDMSPQMHHASPEEINSLTELFAAQVPDFDEHSEEILSIIDSGIIPSHVAPLHVLQLAHQMARDRAAKGVSTTRRRQKSISGGAPGPQSGKRSPSPSIRGSLERAMGAA